MHKCRRVVHRGGICFLLGGSLFGGDLQPRSRIADRAVDIVLERLTRELLGYAPDVLKFTVERARHIEVEHAAKAEDQEDAGVGEATG